MWLVQSKTASLIILLISTALEAQKNLKKCTESNIELPLKSIEEEEGAQWEWEETMKYNGLRIW